MEAFLFACMLVVLVIRWIYLRNRIDALENRLFVLERASHATAAPAASRSPPAPGAAPARWWRPPPPAPCRRTRRRLAPCRHSHPRQ